MLDNGNGKLSQTERHRLEPSEGEELCRADGYRWDTALFQLNGIVDTPRRA
jgi:hypothetical protein